MTHGFGMLAEKLARRDSTEVGLERQAPQLKTFLVQLVEGGQARDGEIGRKVIQLKRSAGLYSICKSEARPTTILYNVTVCECAL